MAKYSELEESIRKQRLEHINMRWGQLYNLEKEWGEKALRLLVMANSGGAIATLSFIGASQLAVTSLHVKVALFLFVFGVFLVGVSTAKVFHHMSNLFKSYKIEAAEYLDDKIEWNELCRRDEERAKDKFIDYLIPYLSFGCFTFGCIFGAVALF